MSKKAVLILLVFAFLYSYTNAQTIFLKQPQDTVKPKKTETRILLQDLQSDLESLIANPDFSGSFVGVSVQSLESGDFLFNYNHIKNFLPASTDKIITTAAALDYLGPEFKYTTSLYLDGKIGDNGEFDGNLIVRGSGDPTISTYFFDEPLAFFDDWALKLDSLGIKSIKGNLIADDRYFDNYYYAPGWMLDDVPFPFSAQVNGLTIFDNKVDIYIKPGNKAGEGAKVRLEPPGNYVKIINNIKTVTENNPVEINPYREIKSNIIEINGKIPVDTTFHDEIKQSISIDNPSLYFLNLFKQYLEKNNIRFRGALININDLADNYGYSNVQPVCTRTSPPLKKIIEVINQKSHNLDAEILLKTIAKETTGDGSFTKGVEKIRKFLAKTGIQPDNINIVDGSGLSRLNFISPKYQVALLSYIYHSEYRDLLMNSLAAPGKDGTLKKRLTKSRAEKNVLAKTGSMNAVSNICGYIRTRDSEMLAFSIMINNFSVPESLAQNLQDLIIMRLSSFSRKKD